MAHTSSGVVKRAYWVKDSEVPSHRMATNQQTTAVSPSQRISVSYGMLFSKKANAEVAHAIDAISKTHQVPGNIHKIAVHVAGTLDEAHAVYYPVGKLGHKDPLIQVSRFTPWPASSLAHEYGHYIDHHLFGDGSNRWSSWGSSSRRAKDGYLEPSKELMPVMKALYNSKASQKMIGYFKGSIQSGDKHRIKIYKYWLMPCEMFARAYAQWIGLRSSKLVHDQIHEMRTIYEQYGYPVQWEDRDFRLIAKEFDRLFTRRGLINRGRR